MNKATYRPVVGLHNAATGFRTAWVHAMSGAWAWEPQNGKLYAPQDAIKLGGHFLADEIRLARAYF